MRDRFCSRFPLVLPELGARVSPIERGCEFRTVLGLNLAGCVAYVLGRQRPLVLRKALQITHGLRASVGPASHQVAAMLFREVWRQRGPNNMFEVPIGAPLIDLALP